MKFNKKFYKDFDFYLGILTSFTMIDNAMKGSFAYSFWVSLIVTILFFKGSLLVKNK